MIQFRNTCIAATLLTLLSANAVSQDNYDDTTLLINADIITMNPELSSAEAIAFKDGHIIAVGTQKELISSLGEGVKTIDLDGKTIIPGMFETHDHMFMASGTSVLTDVTPFSTPTLSEVFVKIAGTQVNEDGWILAFGADQTLYQEQRGPHRDELDVLFPDTPVIIYHLSGHGGFANSKALEIADIDEDTPDPQGGHYEKGGDGRLTGYLSGQPALFSVVAYPSATMETARVAAKQRAAAGITTASDLSIMNQTILKTLSKVTAEDDFAVRVVGGLFSTAPNFDKLASSVSDYENERFRVPFVKTWTDGSIQGGTGNLTKGYHDTNYGTGGAQGTQEFFNKQLSDIYSYNLWPALHTNGDGATDMALNAIEFAQKETGNLDIRPQLIHAQYTRTEQIERMAKLNTNPTFFTTHVYYWGDLHHDHTLGKDRAARLSAMKDAFDAGMTPSMHNDAPVSAIDPFLNMQISVMRETTSGRVLGADQAITPYQALQSYTVNGAYQFGMENVAGSLEVGKYADMVIIDKNPLKVNANELRNIEIKATLVGGQVSYSDIDNLEQM